jgi:hypothetical protein
LGRWEMVPDGGAGRRRPPRHGAAGVMLEADRVMACDRDPCRLSCSGCTTSRRNAALCAIPMTRISAPSRGRGMYDLTGRTTMPAVAEILCQRCGALTNAPAESHGASSVSLCLCGGVRQVVRIVRQRREESSSDPFAAERKVHHTADSPARGRLAHLR